MNILVGKTQESPNLELINALGFCPRKAWVNHPHHQCNKIENLHWFFCRLVYDETKQRAECACPFFSVKYTGDGKCYKEYTRGPCPFGQLLVMDKDTGFGSCICGPQLVRLTYKHRFSVIVKKLFIQNGEFRFIYTDFGFGKPLHIWTCLSSNFFQRMYYYEPTGQCFELYKQGPCAEGHILSYNYGQLQPQCKCKDHYHLHVDGKCYSLNTEGEMDTWHAIAPQLCMPLVNHQCVISSLFVKKKGWM